MTAPDAGGAGRATAGAGGLARAARRRVETRASYLVRREYGPVRILALVGLVGLWEALALMGWVPVLFLPSPLGVLAEGWDMAVSGELWAHLAASLRRLALGFAAGPAAGVSPAVAVFRDEGSNVMMPKTLTCGVVLAWGVLALVSLTATAEDKKSDPPALSGTWGKKDGELKIEFTGKDVLKIAPHGDSAVIVIVCDYKVEKEGLVKAKVTGRKGSKKTLTFTAKGGATGKGKIKVTVK